MSVLVQPASLADSSPIEWPLGVYIGQSHRDYLRDPGHGYGAIRDLYLSAVEWWDASIHNPFRDASKDEDRKKAFLRGTALHTHVLDGPKIYEKIYGFMPNKLTNPDALDTVPELVAACQRFGLSTHGNKPDHIDRLIRAKVGVEILWEEQQKFLRSGKLPVDPKDDIRIKLLYAMMMRSPQELNLPDGEHLTIRDLLTNSLNEVSVFWVDENGIRHRARFDMLKPNVTGDLKSITQWKKSNFKTSLLSEIIQRGYMIQTVHYDEARRQLRKAVAEGRVFGGNKTQRKLLDRIARAEAWAWVFVFAKMDGAPQVRGIVVRPDSGQFIKAQQQRDEALSNYLYQLEFHGGLDKPWFDPEVVWEPEEQDWPSFSVLGGN